MNFNASKIKKNIPEEIKIVSQKLEENGFQSYLVGGCVRDLLMEKKPKDWDLTTNATPEEIQDIFPDSIYENQFGTVAIKIADNNDSTLNIIEITTFRLEGKYTDKRHPDEIKFAKNIEEDLSRRDFTINAIALDTTKKSTENLIDPFGGQKDIKNKIIQAVGEPEKRFNEDALRIMRAIRLSVQLDFKIEEKTLKAIKKEVKALEIIANERIRDEFIKIIMTPRAKKGIELLKETEILKLIIPELEQGIGVEQNKHHIYTVFEHNLLSMDYAVKKNYSLKIRLAALLHDIGKPKTKRGKGANSTFHGHEIVGAKMATQALNRLRFSKNMTEKIVHLIRYHLFYYNVGEVTEAGVRRFLRRVGPENVEDFIKLREADRIGSGVPKAVPYKIRHLLFMIEKVKHDPISPKMLKLNGNDIIKILNVKPGPKIGYILNALLDEIIENPEKNTLKFLNLRIKKLGKLSDIELKKLSKQAEEKKEEFEGGLEKEMKEKYYVK
ncbi:HD domain-containing protein [Candidatus Wolfebacteria bacterium]|nr:HD domain-containing protein [Candidatus Wolfebacteria bacterium]